VAAGDGDEHRNRTLERRRQIFVEQFLFKNKERAMPRPVRWIRAKELKRKSRWAVQQPHAALTTWVARSVRMAL
jgi:hypothetical protein